MLSEQAQDAGEHPSFRRAAYRPELCDPLWEKMDSIVASVQREGA
ncbi:hypothetical protein A7982_12422 [Minicystis rosea]|nr:hypothetical protein A7982_12422 [Minicystis rosea]